MFILLILFPLCISLKRTERPRTHFEIWKFSNSFLCIKNSKQEGLVLFSRDHFWTEASSGIQGYSLWQCAFRLEFPSVEFFYGRKSDRPRRKIVSVGHVHPVRKSLSFIFPSPPQIQTFWYLFVALHQTDGYAKRHRPKGNHDKI